MNAVQLIAHGTPGQHKYSAVPDPHPAPGEVVLEVAACGVNHLDLWCEQAALPIPLRLPRIQGCEVAGRIIQIGSEVTGWQIGDRVTVPTGLFCGQCENCQRGEESMCLQSVMLGVQRDGGFAEQVAVPARALARVPEGLDLQDAAALALSASTAMHMLTHRAQVRPGDWVLAIAGASGVGSAAIQIAKGLGARVISTGSTEAKRVLARQLGAEEVLDSTSADWPAAVRRITGKHGADLIVEHVGGTLLQQAFTCLARGGTIVTCGATAGREIALNLWPLFVKQQKLVGSYSRNHTDLVATLEWAAAGRLKPVIDSVFPLAEAPAALARLRSRTVLGKLLVKP